MTAYGWSNPSTRQLLGTCATAGYQQCGGLSCPGPYTCADAPGACCPSGYSCTRGNAYYWQCTPSSTAAASPSATPSPGKCTPHFPACMPRSAQVVRVMTRGCCLSRCARLYYALLIAYCDSVSAAYCGSQSWALRRPQLLHMPIQHTQQQLMSLNLPLLQQATAQATAHTVQHVVAYCTSKSMLAHASLLQIAAYSIDLARWSVCKPSPSCCST